MPLRIRFVVAADAFEGTASEIPTAGLLPNVD
jgi:hypothetical protein